MFKYTVFVAPFTVRSWAYKASYKPYDSRSGCSNDNYPCQNLVPLHTPFYMNSCAILYVANAHIHATNVLYTAEPIAHLQPLSEPMAVIVPMQGM